jgi:hypothetical protein
MVAAVIPPAINCWQTRTPYDESTYLKRTEAPQLTPAQTARGDYKKPAAHTE